MAALGEVDPTYCALQEVLKKAKAQSQVRPVEERIASSKVFIERAKKRIRICQEEVARAQRRKRSFKDWPKGKHVWRISREERVPPTMPANFARELVAGLRARVAERRIPMQARNLSTLACQRQPMFAWRWSKDHETAPTPDCVRIGSIRCLVDW